MQKGLTIFLATWAASGAVCIGQTFYNWGSEPELLNVSGGITFYSMIPEWANSFTLTIDSSKVDANLTNFPLLVNLTASAGIGNTDLEAIFTELGANSNRLTIRDASGADLFVEVEKWDNASTSAQLWVKVPVVSNAADMALTLHYDNDHAPNTTYVGAVGSTPGTNVWRSAFKGVWHISEGGVGTRYDSTFYTEDASPVNYSGDEPTTGQIDGADDLDGVDEYLDGGNPGFLADDVGSISFWGKYTDRSDVFFGAADRNANQRYLYLSGFSNPGEDFARLTRQDGGADYALDSPIGSFPENTMTHFVVQTTGTAIEMFINGASVVVTVSGGANNGNWFNGIPGIDAWTMGALQYNSTFYSPVNGIIDEFRVTDTELSDAEIKAEYNSGNDSLITYTVN